MLTLIIHTDPLARKEVLDSAMRDIGDEYTLTSVDPEQVSENLIRGLLETRGLFDDIHAIIVRGGFSKKESADVLSQHLQAYVESPHQWFFLEEVITPRYVQMFKKAGALVHTEKKEGKAEVKGDNRKILFAISDAVGARNKREAWILYRKALRAGHKPEEVLHMIRWMFRSLFLVAENDSAELHTFVVGKMKRFLKNYPRHEIQSSHKTLTELFHQSHRGEPLEYTLERFLVSAH
jgi:hypothetical protein